MSKLGDMIPKEQADNLHKGFAKKQHNETKSFMKPDINTIIAKASDKYGKEAVEVSLIVKNNAEIRRFTSKNIIDHLAKDNDDLRRDGKEPHVEFLWNKFIVSKKLGNTNISIEYPFTEVFFINALAKSFEQFSANASKTMAAFISVNDIEISEEPEESEE